MFMELIEEGSRRKAENSEGKSDGFITEDDSEFWNDEIVEYDEEKGETN